VTKAQAPRAPDSSNFVPRALRAAFALASGAVFFARIASAQAPISYDVVATFAHDASAFTQGLAYANGTLYESSGQYGHSAVWLKSPSTGAVRRKKTLAANLFGEGLALGAGHIVQLTWQAQLALVYNARLRQVGSYHYDGEGWGLAWDGKQWLMSDGSADIVRRAAADFAETGRITVRDGDRPVTQLNELEYAHGVLFANVWHSDRVAVIDPASGAVLRWLDLSALKRGFAKPPDWNDAEYVLNGIAFNPEHDTFYVTGKCWPVLYEIRVHGLPAR
jgi:glutamine cyclotransferase